MEGRLEHRHARAFRPDERAGDVKSLLRQEVGKVVSRDAAGNVRITQADEIAVAIGEIARDAEAIGVWLGAAARAPTEAAIQPRGADLCRLSPLSLNPMRSPGARRMIQTRTRSVSDTSVEPTQGLGFLRSRSNSAWISGGHAVFTELSACLSNIDRAMAFLRGSADI